MKNTILLIAFFFSCRTITAQKIKNIDYTIKNNRAIINYELVDCPDSLVCNLKVKLKTETGNYLQPISPYGDITNVCNGRHEINWDFIDDEQQNFNGKEIAEIDIVSTTKKLPAKVFSYVEQMPKPDFDLNEYLTENLKYPVRARMKHLEGRVAIKFVINDDGSVSDATLTKGIGKECDEEAMRVVKAMPKWKPGKQNGKYVKVYFTLPIQFRL